MEKLSIKCDIDYHRPEQCTICGGVMDFKGVGEYKCQDCKRIEYDDYGKVRCYIEEHPGVNAAQIEAATGVLQKNIRQLLREARIEIANGSSTFLRCERCGAPIRSGVYCPKCDK